MNATESYGFTPKQIGLMTPSELQPYIDAYSKKIENKYEYLKIAAWEFGIYTLSAINSSNVGNSEWFVGKKANRINYPDKPFDNKSEEYNEADDLKALLNMKRACKIWEKQGLPSAPK